MHFNVVAGLLTLCSSSFIRHITWVKKSIFRFEFIMPYEGWWKWLRDKWPSDSNPDFVDKIIFYVTFCDGFGPLGLALLMLRSLLVKLYRKLKASLFLNHIGLFRAPLTQLWPQIVPISRKKNYKINAIFTWFNWTEERSANSH